MNVTIFLISGGIGRAKTLAGIENITSIKIDIIAFLTLPPHIFDISKRVVITLVEVIGYYFRYLPMLGFMFLLIRKFLSLDSCLRGNDNF